MTARALPTAPAWVSQQEITSTELNSISTFITFWSNKPSFRAEQHTVQSIPTSATTQITCETVVHDSDGGLGVTSPFSYVVPYAGIWDFAGGVGFTGNTTGTRYALLYQNATNVTGGGASDVPVTSNGLFLTMAKGIPCQAGDVIGLYTFQSSGGALNTAANGAQSCWFAGSLESLQTP